MPQPARTVFGPPEIARLSTAYEAAVSTVSQSERAAGLTEREVRRQLACVIIAEAQEGELNPDRLKEAALESLDRPFADPDELDGPTDPLPPPAGPDGRGIP